MNNLHEFSNVCKVSNNEFILEHNNDVSRNVHVTMQINSDGKTEWTNLPQSGITMLNQRFGDSFLQTNPLVALRSLILESTQQAVGFRGIEEIRRVLTNVCQIQQTDPSQKYKIMKKLGQGAFGAVFQVKRLSDGIMLALKYTNPKNNVER